MVFNIAIFSREAIANQSEKVGISKVQQQPFQFYHTKYNCVTPNDVIKALQG